MADLLWADVLGFAPQMSAVSASAQTLILGYVNTTLSPAVFGGEATPKYKLARTLLASHLGQIQITRGDAGQVSSESISASSLAVSFSAASSDDSLQMTSYGKEFARLVRSSPRARLPRVV